MLKLHQITCPNCGGTHLTEDDNKVICLSCRTHFEKERYDFGDDLLNAKFFDAIALRNRLDFDSSEEKLSEIIEKRKDNPDLYFHRLLAKLGVKYVDEDGNTLRKPTISRLQEQPISELNDYEQIFNNIKEDALKEEFTKKLLEIEKIRKRAYDVSKHVENYDIFISFKQRTEDGEGITADCEVAQTIYHYLTKNHYKVFFSKITLEEYSGEEYEPIIYHALQTSRMMLVIAATPKKEYTNSPWVKNEWTRFHRFMKNEIEKTGKTERLLLPILANGYKAEDLTPPLNHLQALTFDASFYPALDLKLNNYFAFDFDKEIKKNIHNVVVQKKEVSVSDISRKTFSNIQNFSIESGLEKQLKIVDHYLKQKDYENAEGKLNIVIEKNPDFYDHPTACFKAFLVKMHYDEDSLTSLAIITNNNKNSIYKLLTSCYKSQDESFLSEVNNICEKIIFDTLEDSIKNVDEMMNYYLSLKNEDKEYNKTLASSIFDLLIQKIKQKKYKEDVVLFYDKALLPIQNEDETIDIEEQYLSLGNSLLQADASKEANIAFSKALDIYEASPGALYGKFICKNGKKPENWIKNESITLEVKSLVDDLVRGNYAIQSPDAIYQSLFHFVDYLIELKNYSTAQEILIIILDSIPLKNKKLLINNTKKYGVLFLQLCEFSASKNLLEKVLSLEGPKDFNVALQFLCAKNNVQNYIEYLLKDIDMYIPENYDYLTMLNEACEKDEKVDSSLYLNFEDIHKSLIQNKEDERINKLKQINDLIKKYNTDIQVEYLIKHYKLGYSLEEFFKGLNLRTSEEPLYIVYSDFFNEYRFASSKEEESKLHTEYLNKYEASERLKKQNEEQLAKKIESEKRIKEANKKRCKLTILNGLQTVLTHLFFFSFLIGYKMLTDMLVGLVGDKWYFYLGYTLVILFLGYFAGAVSCLISGKIFRRKEGLNLESINLGEDLKFMSVITLIIGLLILFESSKEMLLISTLILTFISYYSVVSTNIKKEKAGKSFLGLLMTLGVAIGFVYFIMK